MEDWYQRAQRMGDETLAERRSAYDAARQNVWWRRLLRLLVDHHHWV